MLDQKVLLNALNALNSNLVRTVYSSIFGSAWMSLTYGIRYSRVQDHMRQAAMALRNQIRDELY